VRPALIVALHVAVESGLHLLDGFELGAPPFDADVLVEQCAMQPFGDAVGLRSFEPGGAMLDLFELQEQLLGVLIGPTAEFAAIV
jgi:hypothetical protein